MRVCVEQYGFLPVDKAAFKGEVPEIKNMVPYEPFDFYIKRKLFIHNMGHATCAYLGGLLDLEYIYQAIAIPEVRVLVQNAMLESAWVLHKHYGADLAALQMHITDLLYRFTNAALKDTCQRVGGDPVRKLSPDDRLIGSARLAAEHGITPAYIAVGIASGVHRYLVESNLEQTAEFAEATLIEVSRLESKAPLTKLVLDYYEMICSGCTVKDLLTKADQLKHAGMDAVV